MWVHTQRRQRKLLREGKSSSMTPEKIAALDSLGFDWYVRNVGKKMVPHGRMMGLDSSGDERRLV